MKEVITEHHSLYQADAIFALLQTFEINGNLWIECFDNCREQGYVIKGIGLNDMNIAFTENRNSDNLVVYVYRQTKFPSNLPDENEWNDKKYFSYNEQYKCAEYIVERIKQILMLTKVEEKKDD